MDKKDVSGLNTFAFVQITFFSHVFSACLCEQNIA